ncbi:MAG: autotransporter domain-containing protein [Mesorhizobium sp.]|uniref:autotransporter outer membrane beta-barrel domain-containing protein n=1 Tax=Mesorhizobium sp. TaxID=1871066 RepID=UPI001AD07455|nr:autotransporter domain-containing protein [Mesorhizobium sp.]MBN9217224.1 autotransporter domain-containing protein [Mesorhizobium sp.]
MSELGWDDTSNGVAPYHRPVAASGRYPRSAAVFLAAALAWPQAGLADDVDIAASTNNGISLDAYVGTTAKVEAGVTVGNTTFTLHCNTFPAICATSHAWTLTNNGTIGYTLLKAGGSVINYGTVSGVVNSIWIQGGTIASVDNKLGATISGAIVLGENDPVVGTVTNAGTITSSGQSIGLWNGGSVTNLATGIIQGHGGSNAVAVVQGTSRTVENYGLIQSNDSGYATGVSLQAGTLTNYSGGRILGAYNAVWTYTGASTITNNGYLEASKAQGGGSAIEVDAGATIVNTGTIRSSSTDGSDAGILFNGAGSVTNSGDIGSLTGGLAIKFQGAGTHTLSLDTGSALGGNVQGGSGTDNLVLLGTGTESAARFLGFETLSMQGADWTMTGVGAFATSATVQAGVLRIEGQLASPQIQVLSGGTLAGTGTVAGATTIGSGGTLAPGNSIGTLNVTGALTLAPGSFFAVEADDAGHADKVVSTGAAMIQGGTVNVLAAAGNYAPATTYTILTANGGLSGAFSGVTSNFAFLAPSLTYDANNVYLTLDRNSIDFGAIGGTPNERSAGHGVESLASGNPIYDAILPLDAASARAAFDMVSGEIHASTRTVLMEDSRFVRETMLDRLRAAFTDVGGVPTPALAYADGNSEIDPSDGSGGFWLRGLGAWGHRDSDGNAAAVSRDIGGFLGGADGPIGAGWRIGLIGGYSRSTIEAGERGSSATSEDYHLGVYAGTEWGDIALRSGLAYTWHDIAAQRAVAFGGFAETLKSGYHAGTAQAFGELGYRIATTRAAGKDIAFEPFANLAYVRLSSDGFAESGGEAGLGVQGSHDNVALTTLGVRVGADVDLARDTRLALHGVLGWRHAFGDASPVATMSLPGGAPFDIAGVPMAGSAAIAEVGLDLALSPSARLGVSYNGQFGSGGTDQSLRGTLTLRF